MRRTELPTVPLCQDCGKCCDNIGLPPFEVKNPDLGRQGYVEKRWASAENYDGFVFDLDLFVRMPPALRAEHAAAVRDLKADPTRTPCIWYDAETKRCSQYEWRPFSCRIWEPGDDGCRDARRGAIVQWRTNNTPPAWIDPLRSPAENAERLKSWWRRWWDRFAGRFRRWLEIRLHWAADRPDLSNRYPFLPGPPLRK